MKIIVSIEETVVQDFVIEAESLGEAMEIAEKKYKAGEIVLEPGEPQFRQMSATDGKHYTDWTEF